MRFWCLLVGLTALTVSITSDEPVVTLSSPSSSSAEDVVSDDGTARSWTPENDGEEEYFYEDEEEFLPDPEALTDDQQEDDDEVVVLDEKSRVVAEALIQELDQISNNLQEDEDVKDADSAEPLPSASALSSNRPAVVRPEDVRQLEKMLHSAGLTPNSPLMQNLMQQRHRNAIPATALGPSGPSSLSSLLAGAPINVGSAGDPATVVNSLLTPGMTKKNVEEIKKELKHMLFGPDNRKNPNLQNNRRQGAGRPRPQQPASRNPQRRPLVPTGRPLQRQQHVQPQQPSNPNNRQHRPHIPIFLRPPRPSRPTGPPGADASGRPSASQNELTRQPIHEFRAPSSDFRLPESPFRQQIAATQFSPPAKTTNPSGSSSTIGNLNSPPSLRTSSPAQQPHRPTGPRPTEEEFRPSLLNHNLRPSSALQPTSKTSPPTQFQLPPPLSFRPSSGPQSSSPSTQVRQQQQPPAGRPIVGGSILAHGHFDAGTSSNHQQQPQPNRGRIVRPECELFSEGVCLDARNYPTELISNYLNRNKPVLETMLAEVRSQSADDLVDGVSAAEERRYSYSHYYGNRRQGEDTHAHRDFAEEGGFLCPSEVKYARPQLAQTSRGVWKYIINMGEHTQTIRMERCLKPSGSCSYVSPHYKSHCIQVYNYHRLLSFEEGKGMHVDIYKIPVGCSCHVQGYAYLYPPLDGKTAGHIIPPAFPTDLGGNGNSLGANRKTGSQLPGQQDTSNDPSFGPPTSLRDFSSFMDQQFSGQFGPFSSKNGAGSGRPSSNNNNSNRRMDQLSQDEEEEDYVAQPSNKRPQQKAVNYDYHPILEFFNDKP